MQAGNAKSARGAEMALTQAHLIDLPNTGALVLPLAAHTFLVGLLVIEQLALLPQLPAGSSDEAGQQQPQAADKQLTSAGMLKSAQYVNSKLKRTFLICLLVIEQLTLLAQLPAGSDQADHQQLQAATKQLTLLLQLPAGSSDEAGQQQPQAADKQLTSAGMLKSAQYVNSKVYRIFLICLLVIEQLALLPQLPAGSDQADQQQPLLADKQLTPAGTLCCAQ